MTENVMALQGLATAVAHLRQAEARAAHAVAAIPTPDERVVVMSRLDVQAAIRRGAALAALNGHA